MTTKLNKKVADKKTKESIKWLGDAKYVYEYGNNIIIEYVGNEDKKTAFSVDQHSYFTIT